MDSYFHYKKSNGRGNNVDTIIINDLDENKNNIPEYIKFMQCNHGYHGYITNVVNNSNSNSNSNKKNINEKITNYPANLESLLVNGSRCIDYNFLPYSLKTLILYVSVLEPLLNLPPNLEVVKITTECNLHIILPDSVKYFNLSGSRNRYKDIIVLSKNLTHLKISSKLYNQIYDISDDIPDTIVNLQIMGNTHIKVYPKNVQHIIFCKEYNLNNKPLANFPDSVISLSILRDRNLTNLALPQKLQELHIKKLNSPCFLKSSKEEIIIKGEDCNLTPQYSLPDTIRKIQCDTLYNIPKLFDDNLLNISEKFKIFFIHGVITINGYSYDRYKKIYR
jgi:hypothetical protein